MINHAAQDGRQPELQRRRKIHSRKQVIRRVRCRNRAARQLPEQCIRDRAGKSERLTRPKQGGRSRAIDQSANSSEILTRNAKKSRSSNDARTKTKARRQQQQNKLKREKSLS